MERIGKVLDSPVRKPGRKTKAKPSIPWCGAFSEDTEPTSPKEAVGGGGGGGGGRSWCFGV